MMFSRLAASLFALALLASGPARAADIAPGFSIEPVTFDLPINEQPYFAFAQKNAAQKEADARFVESITDRGQKNAEQMAQAVVIAGWDFLHKQNDPATAAKRFNQAWLLDPARSDIAHGFALIVFERMKNTDYALRLFEVATRLRKPIPPLYRDYGRVLLAAKRPAEAIAQLQRALELMPGEPSPIVLLAQAYLDTAKPEQACRVLAQANSQVRAAVEARSGEIRKRANCA